MIYGEEQKHQAIKLPHSQKGQPNWGAFADEEGVIEIEGVRDSYFLQRSEDFNAFDDEQRTSIRLHNKTMAPHLALQELNRVQTESAADNSLL